jgi:hypothetical protein
MNKRCGNIGCRKHPIFAEEGTVRGRFCREHAAFGMVDVVNKRCESTGCRKQPAFAFFGETRGRFCREHAAPGMVDVSHKRCESVGCQKHPTFAEEGSLRRRFCREHATPGSVSVIRKWCEGAGCRKQPTFAEEGATRGRFCREHAAPDSVDVVNKRCESTGCRKQPTFAEKGVTRGRFCREHAAPDMVNVKAKHCESAGCQKQPTFAEEGATRRRFCREHATPDSVDVSRKRCGGAGCRIGACYGIPGAGPTHCAKHKTLGMVRRPNRRCAKCKHSAIFGFETFLTHCANHRQPGEANLVERLCTVCGLEEKLNSAGNCIACGTFPKMKRAHLVKQRAVNDAFEAANIRPESYDAAIERGLCSRKRPDFVFDGEGHKLVVEVDEFQHQRNGYDCEVARMYEIVGALGHRTIFIRYNPDHFRDAQGKRRDPPREQREVELVRWVRHLRGPAGASQALAATAWLLVGYMYYDGWDGKLALEEMVEPAKLPAIEPEVSALSQTDPEEISSQDHVDSADLEDIDALLADLLTETAAPTPMIPGEKSCAQHSP